MNKYIHNLIKQGEHQTLDFKFEIGDSKKIARTMSAFANTDGGTLLVGVKDNGAIAGVRSEEEYYMVESAAQLFCKPELDFEVQKWTVDGKTVLEVKIPKLEKLPCYAKTDEGWRAFSRYKDQCIMANSVLHKVWKLQSKKNGVYLKYSESEKALLAYLEENESITLSKFCRLANITKSMAEKILVDMLLLDLISIELTEKGATYSLLSAEE